MLHWRFAGNCLNATGTACFEDGIGPDKFDCSGLVIRALSDVMGKDVHEDFKGVRHVRDMWEAASAGMHGFGFDDFAAGNLLITERKYNVRGRTTIVPGHVGIISCHGTEAGIIHANPAAGRVEEKPLKDLSAVLGILSVKL